jgi:hypothetical protein
MYGLSRRLYANVINLVTILYVKNCNCNGTAAEKKTVYVNKCVIDSPNNFCVKLQDWGSCVPGGMPTSSSPTLALSWFINAMWLGVTAFLYTTM